MSNSFSQKQIRLTFTLSNGSTFQGATTVSGQPANVLKLLGLRTLAHISAQGAPAFPQCDLIVFGMSQSDMAALSSLTFKPTGIQRNTVVVEADSGDGRGFSTVFAGQIVTAYTDYVGVPEVALRLTAQMGYFDQINPATPTSYTGSTPVATIISNIAAKMGYAFENNGVTTVLPRPQYFPGTLTEQLRDAVAAAGIDQYMEGGPRGGSIVQTVAICPKGATRNVPTYNLSPSTGLVGYPTVDSRGYVRARALYNPAFRFGGPLTISGSVVVLDELANRVINSRANGNWLIGQLSHSLDAFKFDGQWFSDMLLYPPGQEPPQQ